MPDAKLGTFRRIARNALALMGLVATVVLSVPVILIQMPFWLVALATRTVSALLSGVTSEWFEIIEPDDQLGWRLRPHMRVRVRDSVGQPFQVSTDAEGWRAPGTIDDAEVVAIGDSFAFGHAIDDKGFFPALIDEYAVKAVGAPGYSMVHMLLLTRSMQERLRDKHVVWLVYEGNDLDDSLKPEMDGYRVPFVRRNGGGEWVVEERHVDDRRWRIPSPLHAHEALVEISLPTFHSRRVHEASAYLVEEGRDCCRAVNARFSVALVPDISDLSTWRIKQALATRPDSDLYEPEAPERMLSGVCRELGVDFLSLRDHLGAADYWPADVHWNRSGHARVARALAAHHSSGSKNS